MTGPMTDIVANSAWRDAETARLSVLIPFYNDDPSALITALAHANPHTGVEFITFDDGRPDADLNAAVCDTIQSLDVPGAVATSRLNRGRSAARNRLAQIARGQWLLFLDADMVASPGFLMRWLLALENTRWDAVFGGYAAIEPTAQTRVHSRLAASSDGLDAAERLRIGPTSVCSSNLAVRREVMEAVCFDEAYAGWGWEDVDWALSAAQRFSIGHIDNPAGHAGLETVPALLAKFAQTGPNFARLLARHPSYADRPGARMARRLKAYRLGWLARAVGAAAARAPLPDHARVLGLKLFRAGVCAKALAS